MKTWIKRTLVAVVAVAAIGGGVAACSHRDHGPSMGYTGNVSSEDVAQWRGRVLERAGSELKLDAAQQQRLGVLFDKLNEQRSALMAGSDPRSTMTALIAGDKFDRSRATALIGEKTDAVKLKSPEVVTAAADFFDTLNPEQQAKVREFLAKRGHGRGHGHRG